MDVVGIGMGVLSSAEVSESLLVETAMEFVPGVFGKVMLESEGVRGSVGQTMLPVLHSSGMFPLRHCIDGKQLTTSVVFESMLGSMGRSVGG